MPFGRPDLRRAASAHAALVRVPNLFTAPPDALGGAALALAAGSVAADGAPGGTVDVAAVVAAGLASALLYAGGTTLNDYFDAPVDAEERPERPIPAGLVPRRRALGLGLALLVAGTAVAALGASWDAGVVAAALALVVLAYDGALSGGRVGFLAMGSARGLDVVLGAAAVAPVATFPSWLLGAPLAVGLYVAGVTFLADAEVAGADRSRVLVAGGGAAVAGLAVLALLVLVAPGGAALALGVALVVGFLAWTGRALTGAYADPVPETVGPAIGTCVLAIVVLDAAFAAVAGPGWALLALGFLVPAVGLSRAFDVS